MTSKAYGLHDVDRVDVDLRARMLKRERTQARKHGFDVRPPDECRDFPLPDEAPDHAGRISHRVPQLGERGLVGLDAHHGAERRVTRLLAARELAIEAVPIRLPDEALH